MIWPFAPTGPAAASRRPRGVRRRRRIERRTVGQHRHEQVAGRFGRRPARLQAPRPTRWPPRRRQVPESVANGSWPTERRAAPRWAARRRRSLSDRHSSWLLARKGGTRNVARLVVWLGGRCGRHDRTAAVGPPQQAVQLGVSRRADETVRFASLAVDGDKGGRGADAKRPANRIGGARAIAHDCARRRAPAARSPAPFAGRPDNSAGRIRSAPGPRPAWVQAPAAPAPTRRRLDLHVA